MAHKENPLHVLFDDATDFRRHVLLGAVDAIKTLENYEYFKSLKTLKKKKFLELNEKIKSVNDEMSLLIDTLPHLKEGKIEQEAAKVEVKREMPVRVKDDGRSRELRKE